MKKSIIILLLLSSFAAKAQFSIKSKETKFGYILLYTNDGWKSKREIMYYTGVYHRYLTQYKFNADKYIANQKLNSFSRCENHNKVQYRKLEEGNIDPRVYASQ
jgi:hypothetical protein